MSKFVETDYTNKRVILKFPNHSVQIVITVSDEGVVADEDGKKILKAGTIVGAKTGSLLKSEDTLAVASNNANAEVVLLDDVDVTYGPKECAAVIHGFIDLDKLPEAPTDEAIAALKQITFVE